MTDLPQITVPNGLTPAFQDMYRRLYAQLFLIQGSIVTSDLIALEMAVSSAQSHHEARELQVRYMSECNVSAAFAAGKTAQAESRSCRAALTSLKLIGADRQTSDKSKLRKIAETLGAPGSQVPDDRWANLIPPAAPN